MATDTVSSRAVVETAWAAFSDGDFETLLGAMADQVSWELVGGDQYMPDGAIFTPKTDVRDRLIAMAPLVYDMNTFCLTPINVFVDEPHVIMEFTVTSKLINGGEYRDVRYAGIFRVENGKIVEIREYADSLMAKTVLLAAPNPA